MASKFTLGFLKPECVAYPYVCSSVIESILSNNLKIVAANRRKLKRVDAESFYAVHKGRFFYERLVAHVTSGWLVAMILVSDENNALEKWRNLMGNTKVFRTVIEQPLSLRGRFGVSDTRNVCHGSDSEENMIKEALFFFPNVNLRTQLNPLSEEEIMEIVHIPKPFL